MDATVLLLDANIARINEVLERLYRDKNSRVAKKMVFGHGQMVPRRKWGVHCAMKDCHHVLTTAEQHVAHWENCHSFRGLSGLRPITG